MKKTVPTTSDIRSENMRFPFYFLSDNHISTRSGPEQSKRLSDMLSLLDKIGDSGGTVFILGDFFDFWFDKNNYVPPALEPLITALKKIVDQGIEVHYIGGNHDYWIEGYLTAQTGIRFYPDPLSFEWRGKRFYCQHGDDVIYAGKYYPLIRRIIRHPVSVSLLKILPVRFIYKIGERVSHYNRHTPDIPRVSERLIAKMTAHLEAKLKEGYDIALTGHIHQPSLTISDNGIWAILGDWIHHRTYGYMDESGFKLIHMK